MVKIRFILSLVPSTLLRTSLIAVLLVACAPAATSVNAPAAPTQTATAALIVTSEPTNQPVAAASTAQPIATSRGPKLEATDPKTVSMASGGLQFVEFFEFW